MKLNILNLFIIIVFTFGVTSCSNVKSYNDLYTSFFVGEDGTQFFIKPLEFFHLENDAKLDLDITFRYKDTIKDSVTVNLTLYSTTFLKNIDFVEMIGEKQRIKSNNIKLIYIDKNTDLCENRYSVKFLLKDYLNIFQENNFSMNVNYLNYDNIYLPDNSSNKKIRILNENLINLFN